MVRRTSGADLDPGDVRGRDLDLDLQGGDRVAALHLDLDLVAFHRDVLCDNLQDLLPKDRDEIGLSADDAALMGKENLKPLAGDGRRAAFREETDQVHAALRPKSLPSKPLRSLGTTMSTASPRSRRAASR